MDVASLNGVFAATAAFVFGHLVLSSIPVRRAAIGRFGDGGFRIGYSLVVTGAFVWMLFAYGAAPYIPLWTPQPGWAWLPVAVMPVAAASRSRRFQHPKRDRRRRRSGRDGERSGAGHHADHPTPVSRRG